VLEIAGGETEAGTQAKVNRPDATPKDDQRECCADQQPRSHFDETVLTEAVPLPTMVVLRAKCRHFEHGRTEDLVTL